MGKGNELQEQLVSQLRALSASVLELEDGQLLVGFKRKNNVLVVAKPVPAEFREWAGAKVHSVNTLTEACKVMGLRLMAKREREKAVPRRSKPGPKKRAGA